MSSWLGLSLAVGALLPVLSLMTALIERCGPIRLRHWVEESGGRLRTLYDDPRRFESYRYLLNLGSKLIPLALFIGIERLLGHFRMDGSAALAAALVVIVVALTELVNRSLIRRGPEEALRRMTILYRSSLLIMLPFVTLLSRLMPRRRIGDRDDDPEEDEASEEEVEAFIDVGTREGILEPEDRDLVWGVVDFGDTQVKSVMTPRIDMVTAAVDTPLEDLARRFVENAVTRMPLYRESVDQVVGILHIRDLLAGLMREPQPSVTELMRPPMLVPETKLLGNLLKMFQARHQQLAIVINEFGGAEGLVTVEDLVEEIVGEIQDEYDDAEPENQRLADGSVLLDGRAAVDVLDEFFVWTVPEESIETVGGLVSGRFGYVPVAGEEVEIEGLLFRVERSDERRILSLRIRDLHAEGKEPDA